MSANEKKLDWQLAGLPGKPYYHDDNLNWLAVEPGLLLRDLEGKPILCRESFRSGETMSAYFGQPVQVVKFFAKGRPGSPDAEMDREKFGFVADWRPSLMQRVVIAAFAWLFDTHVSPVPVKECYTLPTDLNPDSPHRRVVAHRGFSSERKALMAVEGIADQLNVEGRVFEDGGAWFVDIPDCPEVEDMERVVRLSAIIELISMFDIQRTEDSIVGEHLDLVESKVELDRLDAKASRLHCIEKKLDALLAAGGKTPHADAGCVGADVHTLPKPKPSPASKPKAGAAKAAGKKSSAKRSA